jgi:hypothetical protein
VKGRRLCQLLVLAGLAIFVGAAFSRVHADFSQDPLLRLQGFGREAGPVPTTASCGSAISNLAEPGAGGTLYSIARDSACHDVARRRVAIGLAGGLALAVAGFAGVILLEGGDAEPATPSARKQPDSVAGAGVGS